jgi:hypothetical protein
VAIRQHDRYSCASGHGKGTPERNVLLLPATPLILSSASCKFSKRVRIAEAQISFAAFTERAGVQARQARLFKQQIFHFFRTSSRSLYIHERVKSAGRPSGIAIPESGSTPGTTYPVVCETREPYPPSGRHLKETPRFLKASGHEEDERGNLKRAQHYNEKTHSFSFWDGFHRLVDNKNAA